MRIAIFGILIASLIGCGSSNLQPVTPVSPINPITQIVTTRADLPAGWSEIKGSHWSYGIPKDFDKITLGVAKGTLAQHYSITRDLTINLSSYPNDKDLDTFILNNVILNKNIMVLQIMEKNEGSMRIVAINSLAMPTSPQFDTKNSSLDFFVQKEKTVYQLSCFSAHSGKVKAQAETCFTVVDTLRFK